MNSKKIDKLVTIITPTYNRQENLKNLYESLKNQTNNKFEWLIVDDGSDDNTKDIVQTFIAEKKISIQYIYKENNGKHTALNLGIKSIETELTFIVDSDDVLTYDAIDKIYKYWDHDSNWCGMSFLRGYDKNVCIGDKFKLDKFVGNFIDVRFNQNICGDKAEVWVTKLLKTVPFLEYSNEKFFGESYVWTKLAKQYSMLFINEIIYITEYLEGGLTKSGRKLRIECPLGGMANAKEMMSNHFKINVRIKQAVLYSTYGLFAKFKIKNIVLNSGYPILTLISLPIAFIIYNYWRRRYQ